MDCLPLLSPLRLPVPPSRSQPQAVAHIIEAAAKGALVAEKEKGATSAAAD